MEVEIDRRSASAILDQLDTHFRRGRLQSFGESVVTTLAPFIIGRGKAIATQNVLAHERAKTVHFWPDTDRD